MVKTEKILVVEDNDFVRMQIVKFISDEGYPVIECTDGRDALEKIDDDTAMAIVDVRMEPMGGFDFIKSLRGYDVDIPVILVTGDKDPDLLSDAQKLEVAAVLMKPVQKDRLVQVVTRTFESIRA